MKERRSEPRLLCADLVEIEWKDSNARKRRVVANLEDISLSGACLQVDASIPMQASVRIRYSGGDLVGIVRYCVYREIGYYLGVEFTEGCKWNERAFKPQHLFDPRRLTPRDPGPTSKSRANA